MFELFEFLRLSYVNAEFDLDGKFNETICPLKHFEINSIGEYKKKKVGIFSDDILERSKLIFRLQYLG